MTQRTKILSISISILFSVSAYMLPDATAADPRLSPLQAHKSMSPASPPRPPRRTCAGLRLRNG